MEDFFLMFIDFERERENVSRGGAEGEEERENPKQAPHFQCKSQRMAPSHEPEIMT